MGPLEHAAVALRALFANPLRSALAMLGIVIGIAAVIALVAVGSGARAEIAAQIRTLGADLLLVQSGAVRQGGVHLARGSRHTLTEADAAAIRREMPEVAAVAPAVQGRVQLVHGNRNWASPLVGVVPDHLLAREWQIAAGRAFTAEEVAVAAKVALLGQTVAARLFESEDPVGRLVRINRVPFTVAGVLAARARRRPVGIRTTSSSSRCPPPSSASSAATASTGRRWASCS